MRHIRVLFAASLAIIPSATQAHRLISAGEQVEVARTTFLVTPSVDWNRLDGRPGNRAERWTVDGELLNDLIFFGEVADGDTLYREVDRRDRPLPQFSETMLLTDIPVLLESSNRIAKGVASFEVTSAEPRPFLGHPGVQFSYEMLSDDDIRRRGRAVATIIEGKLFMITYEAPVLYFWDKNLADFEQVVSSARLAN